MDKAIKTPNRTGILVRALIVLAMCGIVNSAAVFVSNKKSPPLSFACSQSMRVEGAFITGRSDNVRRSP